MIKKFLFILFICSLLSSCGSCGSNKVEAPDLGGIYTRAAKRSHVDGNPVIVIPGILGSKLRDYNSGKLVWGAFEKSTADPEEPEGALLLALPMKKGAPLSELRDHVHPDGALDKVRVSILGLPIELNAYINILSTLGAGGYLDEEIASNKLNAIDYGDDHFTCFQFAYDWRLDNVENARRLKEFIIEKRAYILEEYKKRGIDREEVKFDIVAHSMGGLVTRYFLRYGGEDLPADGQTPEVTWDGAEYVEKVVIIGTPNAGSVDALGYLFAGRGFGIFLPKYDSAIIGTMPSIYQLLPRSRHGGIKDESGNPVDILDADLWIENGWGLADPGQEEVLSWLLPDVSDPAERREIAIDHMRKSMARGKQFQEAIDIPSETPEGLNLYLIAGDAIPTGSGVTVSSRPVGKNGEKFKITDFDPGDGTVTRASALMDERKGAVWQPRLISPINWSSVTFLFSDHLGLTKDPVFSDNVLYFLLEQPD